MRRRPVLLALLVLLALVAALLVPRASAPSALLAAREPGPGRDPAPLPLAPGSRLAPAAARALATSSDAGVEAPAAPAERARVAPWPLELRVVDEDGRGVPDARIELRTPPPLAPPAHREPPTVHALAHTDPDGRARLAVPDLPGAHLAVLADGFGEAVARATPGLDDARAPLVVRLARAARLGVEVVDSAGAPIAGREVRLSLDGWPLAGGDRLLGTGRHWLARTDERGRCALADLPAEVPLRAELGGERGRRETVRLAPGEEREVRWHVGGAARVVGVAREPSGAPAAGLEVALVAARGSRALHGPLPASTRPRATTDAAGRFAFEDVAPGDWAVGPLPVALGDPVAPDERRRDDASEREARAPAPYGPAVEVPEGTGEVAVELVVHRGGFVRGLVLDAAGAPADGAVVQGIDFDRGLGAPSALTSAGRFRLGPLPPGTYRLRAQGRGLTFSPWHEARPGEPELVLRLAPGGELLGRALDGRTGAPLPGVLVRAVPVDGLEGGTYGGARTNEAGLFRLHPGRAGTFDVVAVDAAGERVAVAAGIVVAPGASAAELRLHLARAARVTVRTADPAGRARVRLRAAGACLRLREVLAADAPLEVLVPPGRVEVDVLEGWPMERVARTLAAEARVDAPATVVLPP